MERGTFRELFGRCLSPHRTGSEVGRSQEKMKENAGEVQLAGELRLSRKKVEGENPSDIDYDGSPPSKPSGGREREN